MTRSHEIIAAIVAVVLAGGLAWLIHYEFVSAAFWPLVGSEWRAERRTDLPGPDGRRTAGSDGLETPATTRNPQDRAGEAFTDDEWEQLDPDTQAATLIAEWHAPESEAMTSTDTLRLLDDAELLLWDCRRQVQRIKDIRHDYRLEMGRLMAERAREIDARAA